MTHYSSRSHRQAPRSFLWSHLLGLVRSAPQQSHNARWARLLLAALLSLLPTLASAQEEAPPTKSLAPYFVVNGSKVGTTLPLKANNVSLTISGSVANVEVEQVYQNQGLVPISAQYVFPASTHAAVHGLTLQLGNREIEAKIKKRAEAKKEYDAAKSEGKAASLLEQQRPNVFTMSVANIMPGTEVKARLRYTELLVPEQGVYELSYPTVVGPRYSEDSTPSAPSNQWIASPYLKPKAAASTDTGAAPYTFSLSGRLNSAVPVDYFKSPTHNVDATWESKQQLSFRLQDRDEQRGDRDLVLRYRLAGNQIQSGLLLFEKNGEKFFNAILEPPAQVTPDSIPNREYVFVLDVSGSMHGFPLETATDLMSKLITQLRPTDYFNVMFFSGGSTLLSQQSLPATTANLEKAKTMLQQLRGGGGTQLLKALKRAMTLTPQPRLSRSFVVVTDGYISAERDVFEYIHSNVGDANVFSFGIGSSVNRFLVEGIARAGLGTPFVVTDPQQANDVVKRFQRYIQSPVLTDIKLSFEGFSAYDLEPAHLPDLLAERPIVVQGKWRGTPRGKVIVTGLGGQGAFRKELAVQASQLKPENAALPYLWARTRIARLSDYGHYITEDEKAAVTNLGLKYNLLTQYTSFIAVSREVVNPNGGSQNVKQPLPLPHGVSELAVGGRGVHSADEPELWLLLLLLFAAVGIYRSVSLRTCFSPRSTA